MAIDLLKDRGRSYQQQWHGYGDGGETWFGFEQAQRLDGLPPELLFVPLFGHTLGHAGVAVQQGDSWLLHAGDAYFYHAEMDPLRPSCTPGLRFYQSMIEKDRAARLDNQARLRELQKTQGGRVTVFCSHDAIEFERLAGRAPGVPVEALSASGAAAFARAG